MDTRLLSASQMHVAALSLPCENAPENAGDGIPRRPGGSAAGAARVCITKLPGIFVISPHKGNDSGKQNIHLLPPRPKVIPKASEIYFY